MVQMPYPEICLIAAYFGRLPNYFDLWKLSAERNNFIDFFLVTDATEETLGPLPENIKLIRMTMEQFRLHAEAKLKTKVSITRAYKICDLKPTYAKLFEDQIQKYKFWGYCDLDVIWGDLKQHFPRDLFENYDRIQENAHLTFFRNTEEIRNLYSSPLGPVNYQTVFADPNSYAFDEYGGFHTIVYRAGLSRIWLKNYIDAAVDRFHISLAGKKNYRHQIFYWEGGKVFREHISNNPKDRDQIDPEIIRTEFSYIHLQKRKMKSHDFNAYAVRGFYIAPDRFIPKQAFDHSIADFYAYNPRKLKKIFVVRRIRSLVSRNLSRAQQTWSLIAGMFRD